MSAARRWSALDVVQLGGANVLVVLPSAASPVPWGVVVSRIHGREYASPVREGGRYGGLGLAETLPARPIGPPRELREMIYAAARRIARPYLGPLRRPYAKRTAALKVSK